MYSIHQIDWHLIAQTKQ